MYKIELVLINKANLLIKAPIIPKIYFKNGTMYVCM